jgi:biotin synthase
METSLSPTTRVLSRQERGLSVAGLYKPVGNGFSGITGYLAVVGYPIFVAEKGMLMESLEKLAAMDDETLFSQAKTAGGRHADAYWYPIVLDGACRTSPPCRHCKWESFKSGKPDFSERRSLDDVLRTAETALREGATHLLVPSGWMGYDVPDYFCDCIKALKSRFDADVYGLFGSIGLPSLERLREAGMDGYQCGLESPDVTVYRAFRPGGDTLADRIETLSAAKGLGLKIWSGFLLAFGLTDEAALLGLRFLSDIGVDWVAVQPFVPYPHTPLQTETPTNPYRWARLMALARLYFGEQVNLVATENSGAYENFMSLTGANAFYIFPKANRFR